MSKTPSLDKLIFEFRKLPGVGSKTAERFAYFVLKNLNDYPMELSKALTKVKENIQLCETCYCFTEDSKICEICDNPNRKFETICVVENPEDIYQIEASGVFQGLYHVLHGVISPLEKVTPENLKIKELEERIREKKVKEVILVLDADLEGDTTALYLCKKLKEKSVRISRIAHGIPIGGDIDYIDNRTLGRALENRVEL